MAYNVLTSADLLADAAKFQRQLCCRIEPNFERISGLFSKSDARDSTQYTYRVLQSS